MSTESLKGGAGTLSWSAPETFKGEYSEKNDTYAFAMVMYETLTKVNKKMEERGLSVKEQETDWLEENPLKTRRPDLGQVPRDSVTVPSPFCP